MGLATFDRYPLASQTRKFLTETKFGHLIDGEVVPSLSGDTMPVYDPATGAEFMRIASGRAEDADRAAIAARKAFDDGRWRNMSAADKEKCLRRLTALLEENRELLMDLDVLDGG